MVGYDRMGGAWVGKEVEKEVTTLVEGQVGTHWMYALLLGKLTSDAFSPTTSLIDLNALEENNRWTIFRWTLCRCPSAMMSPSDMYRFNTLRRITGFSYTYGWAMMCDTARGSSVNRRWWTYNGPRTWKVGPCCSTHWSIFGPL